MLSERLNLLDENNKIKDAEIKRLTLMIQNHWFKVSIHFNIFIYKYILKFQFKIYALFT